MEEEEEEEKMGGDRTEVEGRDGRFMDMYTKSKNRKTDHRNCKTDKHEKIR